MLIRILGAASLLFVTLMLTVAVAHAQDSNDDTESFTLQIDRPINVATGDSVGTIIVINDDAKIDGTVEDTLVVINGNVTVSGQVRENIVVVEGTLNLESTAQVENVNLFSSDLTRADGAIVSGDINKDTADFSLGFGIAVLFALWWVGVAIVAIVAGILFSWLGRNQLYGTVETIRSQFVPSLITALLVWIIVPIVSVVILFTVLGTPLGLASFGILLPLLLLLGFCAIGAWIGSYLWKPETSGKAIGSTTIGIGILLLVSLIPFVVVLVALAAMLGSGGFIYRAFKRAQDSEPPPTSVLDNESQAITQFGQ